MALQLADRVQQLGSANTTVSFNLTSTPAGFQAFSPAITTGNTLYYTAYDGTNWEVGVGTLTSSSLLTRTTILSSSNAGAAVSTFGGTVTVWLDYPSEKSVIVNDLGDVLVNQSYDQGTGVLQVTGASSFNGAVVDKSLNLQGGNNYFKYSQTIATGSFWASGGVNLANNVSTAPDGTNTACTITATNVAGRKQMYAATFTSIGLSGVVTASAYVKPNGYTNFYISDSPTGTFNALFSLTGSGSVTSTGGSAYIANSATITADSNGFYRVSITFTSSASAAVTFCGAPASGATYDNYTCSYTGDGTSGIYIWGAQLELGSVASAYTPTTTVAVTTTNNINVPSGQVFSGGGITATTPAYSFSQSTNTGLFLQSTNQIGVSSGGSRVGYFASGAFWSDGNFGLLNNGNGLIWNGDTSFLRDAANTLAQRNSTNGQSFRLYNTYTDASNYERLSVDWTTTANTATISTQNAGTGSARNLAIGQDLYVNSVRVGLGGGGVSSNTVVGNGAMAATASGTNNSGFGVQVLRSLTSGNNNVGFGSFALSGVTSTSNNSAFGENALSSNTGGNNSVFGASSSPNGSNAGNLASFGFQALNLNTSAGSLSAFGTQALYSNTTNVATLGTITGGTGYTNGTYTGVVMTLSSGSTAITYPTATIVVAGGVVTTVTLTSNGVGFKDTTTVLTAPAASIGGTGSGFTVPVATLQSGTGNVAVGYQAGYSNSVGISSVYVGYQAGFSTTTGNYNLFSGYQAGYSNSSGQYNVYLGNQAGYLNTTSSGNVAVGLSALYFGTSANNTALGYNALYNTSSGAKNIGIGNSAGYGNASANANTTGSNNTYIGYQTVGSANNNTNEMVIGYQAVGLGSNTTVIGNTSTTLTQTYGVTKSTNYTVATLPSASTSGVGARAFVTDALAPVFGSTVVTGGAVATPVYSNGTSWYVG